MKRTKIAEMLRTEPVNTEVVVKGWVKAFRNNQFIALNDGSCAQNLQVVVDFENTDPALIDRIKFICTTFDPGAGRYKIDYGLMFGSVIAAFSLLIFGLVIAREWRKTARRA